MNEWLLSYIRLSCAHGDGAKLNASGRAISSQLEATFNNPLPPLLHLLPPSSLIVSAHCLRHGRLEAVYPICPLAARAQCLRRPQSELYRVLIASLPTVNQNTRSSRPKKLQKRRKHPILRLRYRPHSRSLRSLASSSSMATLPRPSSPSLTMNPRPLPSRLSGARFCRMRLQMLRSCAI